MRLHGRLRGSRALVSATALAAALVAHAGCRSSEAWSYDKPRATPAQLDRDLTQCAQQARPTGAFAYPALTGPDREALNLCMEKRGYTVTRRPPGG
jgi:ABC-type sugar transport system substrate-binding protein